MFTSRITTCRSMCTATLFATAVMIIAPSCGDDTATAPAGDLDDFCAIAVELTEQEGLPTPDQLAEYQSLAPDEIAGPVDAVVSAFESAGDDPGAVFADQSAVDAMEELGRYEAEVCGLEPPADGSDAELDPNATRVDVAASDYMFATEFPTSAGRYSFVMSNEGSEAHLLVLAQLDPDADLDDVLATEGEAGVIVSYESGIAVPGGEAVVTADLEPGRWVMVCPIPNDEGTSHAALGMLHEFTIE